jgi:quercetin dioxygenase-like cupin family protein
MVLLGKSTGTGHRETHPENGMLYVLDGAMTMNTSETSQMQSMEVSAGMTCIEPPGHMASRSVDR